MSTPNRSSPTNKSMNEALMLKLMATAEKEPAAKAPKEPKAEHTTATLVKTLVADKSYRDCKPTDKIPQVSEHELHKSLGIHLLAADENKPGWYDDGKGNLFFMNKVNAKKGLRNCHLGMYYLTQARAQSREAQKKSNDFQEDFLVAYMTQLSFMARQLRVPAPSIEVESKSQAFHLYKKYLCGFSTYTPCNMQISRVACRVAISRLGYNPTQGLWCTEADCLRFVTLSEYGKQVDPEDARDTSNVSLMLLTAMLKEWMVHHGHVFAAEPAEPDYSTWPEVIDEDGDYLAEPKPSFELAPATTTSARARNALQAMDFQPNFKSDDEEVSIPTDTPHASTHYLVENNKARKFSLIQIFLQHGNLEVEFTMKEKEKVEDANVTTGTGTKRSSSKNKRNKAAEGSKNDYLRLKRADHVACTLHQYEAMTKVLDEETKARASLETTLTVPEPEVKYQEPAKDQEPEKDQEPASPLYEENEQGKRRHESDPKELLTRKSRRFQNKGSGSEYSNSSGHDSEDNLDE